MRLNLLLVVFVGFSSITISGCGSEAETSGNSTGDTFQLTLPDGYDAGTSDVEGSNDDDTSTILPNEDVFEDDSSINDTVAEEDTATGPADTVEEDTTPPPTVIPNTNFCSPVGGAYNIYDLQNPECPDHPDPEPTSSPGLDVELSNVIVTAVYTDTFFVQEQSSGPYSGIAVFAHGLPLADLEVGMRIQVNGSYSEYFGNSQLYLYNWTVQGTANVPLPYVAEYPEHLATGGAAAEWFEGVLVRVENVETIHTQPDCPDHYGEFEVTGDLRIDDMGYLWDARLGDEFASITGPLHFAFGNHKIEPRTEDDVNWTAKGGDSAVSKCVTTECEVNEEETGSQLVVISEIMVNPYGEDQLAEWIELYNPGNNTVSIQGWQLKDCNDQEWTISGGNTTMPPKGFLLLGPNGDPATNGDINLDIEYADAFYLPNTVGSVLLFDAAGFQGQLVDQVRYSAFDPWEVLTSGKSLERTTPTANGTEPASWSTGTGVYGSTDNRGTPGAPNTDW